MGMEAYSQNLLEAQTLSLRTDRSHNKTSPGVEASTYCLLSPSSDLHSVKRLYTTSLISHCSHLNMHTIAGPGMQIL